MTGTRFISERFKIFPQVTWLEKNWLIQKLKLSQILTPPQKILGFLWYPLIPSDTSKAKVSEWRHRVKLWQAPSFWSRSEPLFSAFFLTSAIIPRDSASLFSPSWNVATHRCVHSGSQAIDNGAICRQWIRTRPFEKLVKELGGYF